MPQLKGLNLPSYRPENQKPSTPKVKNAFQPGRRYEISLARKQALTVLLSDKFHEGESIDSTRMTKFVEDKGYPDVWSRWDCWSTEGRRIQVTVVGGQPHLAEIEEGPDPDLPPRRR